MSQLFEATGEAALELIADMLDPVVVIVADTEFRDAIRGGDNLSAVKIILRNHPQEVLQVLALDEGVPVEEYKPKAIELPWKLIELFNREEVQDLFTSAGQKIDVTSSGSVTETTDGTDGRKSSSDTQEAE